MFNPISLSSSPNLGIVNQEIIALEGNDCEKTTSSLSVLL